MSSLVGVPSSKLLIIAPAMIIASKMDWQDPALLSNVRSVFIGIVVTVVFIHWRLQSALAADPDKGKQILLPLKDDNADGAAAADGEEGEGHDANDVNPTSCLPTTYLELGGKAKAGLHTQCLPRPNSHPKRANEPISQHPPPSPTQCRARAAAITHNTLQGAYNTVFFRPHHHCRVA